MSGIWGWLGGTGAHPAEELLAGLGRTRAATGGNAHHLVRQGAAAGCRSQQAPILGEHQGLLVACSGHPELDGVAGSGALAHRLAAAYRQSGTDLPDRLTGAFALAVLDPAAGRGLLAVDRMGVHDLAYAPTAAGVLFAPRADAVAADPRCDGDTDPQALFDYVYFHMIPRPATAYRGIRRLLPGEVAVLESGEVRTRRYWQPRFTERGQGSVKPLQAAFRDRLRQAVARRADEGPVGTFLSGGTDSSTLTGLLGEVTGEPPRAYSIGFATPGYDELEYARIVGRHFGARHSEYIVTPEDVVTAVPRIAAAFGQPYGNASAVPTYYCARLAHADGLTALIGGDGGDELFAGNARYAKQWILSLYDRIPAWLRGGVIEPLAYGVPGGEAVAPVRKVRRYVEKASVPLPRRLQAYNLVDFLGPERIFSERFLAGVDTGHPQTVTEAAYRGLEGYHLTNRLLALDMKLTLADDDLRKVTGASALGGVEARFPFLDEAVVELASRVPPGQKLRGTRLRHFFKQALRDYLPPETLAKEKHGFGLPFGVWLREHPGLRELAGDSLQTLRNREVIRSAIIDELTGARMDEHAAYFGTLVWVLMMLEQWFQTRAEAPAPEPVPAG